MSQLLQRKQNLKSAPRLRGFQPPHLAYDAGVLEQRRQRLHLSQEEIRALARPFLRQIDPQRASDLLSRPSIANVLAGNPRTEVGSVYAVLCVLGLTWADVITVAAKREAVRA